MSRCTFHVGDVFTEMAKIPDHSVDLIVTSPPFLALRSYLPANHPQKHLEIGSEATPAAYLTTLLALTREWRRILAPHGSLCVELGDTYSGNERGSDIGAWPDAEAYGSTGRRTIPMAKRDRSRGWPLPKSLCGIPTLYAWSLAYGHNLLDPTDELDPWRIRNLVVWHRPNPPVGALGDKVRPSTSYVTVGCMSDKRWFDLDAERGAVSDDRRQATYSGNGAFHDHSNDGIGRQQGLKPVSGGVSNPAGAPPLDCWIEEETPGMNPDVWTIPTAPYKGSHYATYPIALPRRLINLMCPRSVCVVCGEPRRRIVGEAEYVGRSGKVEPHKWDSGTVDRGRPQRAVGMDSGGYSAQRDTLGWTDCGHDNYRRGIVLDCFAGSGTTLAAAAELGRDATGIDLDERNLWLARERVGLFLEEPA